MQLFRFLAIKITIMLQKLLIGFNFDIFSANYRTNAWRKFLQSKITSVKMRVCPRARPIFGFTDYRGQAPLERGLGSSGRGRGS